MAISEDPVAQARRHVSEGEQLVAEQAARVDKLDRHGHDTEQARKLLANLEESLRNMREHLELEEKSK